MKILIELCKAKNVFSLIGTLYFVISGCYYFFPLPEKKSLSLLSGQIENFTPIYKKEIFHGYKLKLTNNSQFQFLVPLGYQDKKLEKRLSDAKGLEVKVLYDSCYGVCGRTVYEMYFRGEAIFDYQVISNYLVGKKRKLRDGMWFSVFTFWGIWAALFALDLYFKSRQKSEQ